MFGLEKVFGGHKDATQEQEQPSLETVQAADLAQREANDATNRAALNEVVKKEEPSWKDLNGSNYSEQQKNLDAEKDRQKTLGADAQSVAHQPEAPSAPPGSLEKPENKSAA